MIVTIAAIAGKKNLQQQGVRTVFKSDTTP